MKKDYLILNFGPEEIKESIEIEIFYLGTPDAAANSSLMQEHNHYIFGVPAPPEINKEPLDDVYNIKIQDQSEEDCGVPEPLEINEDLPLPQDCQKWKQLQDLSPPPFHDDVYNDEGVVSEIKECCPVGPKGESGPTGLYEEELAIKNVLDQLQDTQINMASEQARIFLAREIAKDLRIGGFLKKIYTQF